MNIFESLAALAGKSWLDRQDTSSFGEMPARRNAPSWLDAFKSRPEQPNPGVNRLNPRKYHVGDDTYMADGMGGWNHSTSNQGYVPSTPDSKRTQSQLDELIGHEMAHQERMKGIQRGGVNPRTIMQEIGQAPFTIGRNIFRR